MRKITLILFICISCLDCGRSGELLEVISSTPTWLKEYIARIENDKYYVCTNIYRHEWKSTYYYYVEIPLSSCAYCEVYKQNGEKVNWGVESFNDYIHNRKNEELIWTWKKKNDLH